MDEPVAAAIFDRHLHELNAGKGLSLVFDFGGGTLDTALVDNGNCVEDLVAGNGIVSADGISLGGTDLDKDLFRSTINREFLGQGFNLPGALSIPSIVWDELLEWHRLGNVEKFIKDLRGIRHQLPEQNSAERQQVANLLTLIVGKNIPDALRAIEAAKIKVNSSFFSRIEFLAAATENYSDDLFIDKEISQNDFNNATRHRWSAINSCINNTLSLAGVDPEHVSRIVRVGGSSMNPFVGKILGEKFPNATVSALSGEKMLTAVGLGLSLASGLVF
jgi:molecular chaperone DnaK (HSP70)